MRRKPTKRFWANYKALYGEQIDWVEVARGDPSKSNGELPKRPKNDSPREDYEQIVVATWLSRHGVLFYHVPNGGFRDAREGAKFKKMGVFSGVPDLCICVSRSGYHGLYIELKRVKGGKLTDSQKKWRDDLMREGYAWHMAEGHEQAIKIISDYLNLTVRE